MRQMTTHFAQLGALTSLLIALSGDAQAASVTLVSDPFTDGSRLNGSDPLDVSWYSTGDVGSGSYFVGDNAPNLGSGNYLSWNPGTTTFRALHSASFQSTTLNAPGDAIRLSFDFRFLNNTANEASALRFGLYHDNGQPANGDVNSVTSAENAASGYYVNLSSGTTESQSLFREAGGVNGSTAGADRTQLGSTNTIDAGLANATTYNLVLDLSREVGGLRIEAFVDGASYVNFLDPLASAYFTFNKIAFGNGGLDNSGTRRFRFDNIQVQATVPEPTTGALALLGGVGLVVLAWRKRRCSRAA